MDKLELPLLEQEEQCMSRSFSLIKAGIILLFDLIV